MSYFTEEDGKKLALLPQDEQMVFYRRFAEIQMRAKIADDTWEKSRDDIGKELDKLIEEIHTRLDMIYSFTDGKNSCTVDYHPNHSDYEKEVERSRLEAIKHARRDS